MLTQIISALNLPPLAYVALALAVIWMVKSWMQGPSNIPPYPMRPLPIVGHLPFMRTGIREKMKAWGEKTGDMFSLKLGGRLVVMIRSYDIVKELFIKQADLFSDRARIFVNSTRDGDKGILGASGPSWKEQRTVSLSILRNFGMGKNTLAQKTQEEVSCYLKELSSFDGKPKDVRTLTNTSVSNVICSIIVGRRFDYSDPYFLRFMEIFNEQVRLASAVSPLTAFPWLQYLPGDVFNGKKISKNFDEMEDHFTEPNIKENLEKQDDGDAENFIAAYLIEWEKKKNNKEPTTMDIRQLHRVIGNLFIAGTETTSTTMLWFMMYMLHYPHIQEKLFNEINEVVGPERTPTVQDKPKLKYFNAAIMETQRLCSMVPFGLVHLCKQDFNIGGYTIPAGTMVMPHLDAILHDEKLWEEPLTFQPERFLSDTGDLLRREELIPFSLGRRQCLGESLAKMELFMYLTNLVQRFKLLPAENGKLPPCNYVFGTTCPPQAYQLRFVERRRE